MRLIILDYTTAYDVTSFEAVKDLIDALERHNGTGVYLWLYFAFSDQLQSTLKRLFRGGS